MAENHLAAPTPLEEHRKLAVFAGEQMPYGHVFHVHDIQPGVYKCGHGAA